MWSLAVWGREDYLSLAFAADSQLHNILLLWHFWGKNIEKKVICGCFSNKKKKNPKRSRVETCVVCLTCKTFILKSER